MRRKPITQMHNEHAREMIFIKNLWEKLKEFLYRTERDYFFRTKESLILQNAELFGVNPLSNAIIITHKSKQYSLDVTQTPVERRKALANRTYLEYMTLHSSLEKEFNTLITNHDNAVLEERKVSIYLSHLLSASSTQTDLYSVMPELLHPTLKELLKHTDDELTLINMDKLINPEIEQIVNERVMLNLLLQTS